MKVYIDDILITGRTNKEHLQNLEAMLQRLQEAGLHLNREKCYFMVPSIEYLGYVLDAEGRNPTTDKVKAIRDASAPENATRLHSFLGVLNYYGKFLQNLSSSLPDLLCKNKRRPSMMKLFRLPKIALQANSLLVHFGPDKLLILAGQLMHLITASELSCHTPWRMGRRGPLCTHLKLQLQQRSGIPSWIRRHRNKEIPQLYLWEALCDTVRSQATSIPQMASARIQRWALMLSAYCSVLQNPVQVRQNIVQRSRLPHPA